MGANRTLSRDTIRSCGFGQAVGEGIAAGCASGTTGELAVALSLNLTTQASRCMLTVAATRDTVPNDAGLRGSANDLNSLTPFLNGTCDGSQSTNTHVLGAARRVGFVVLSGVQTKCLPASVVR